MNVRIAPRLASAPDARGHVVVIDVMRAFTTAAYAIASGAERIVLVGTPEEAFALRASGARAVDGARGARIVLVGEDRGRKIAGFDHGNSPAEIERADLRGATVVLRSSSGTQGVVAATHATQVLLGSLVTASATARFLRAHATEVTLVPMGSPFGGDGAEDDACADHLAALVAGADPDVEATLARVRASDAAREALDPAVDWTSADDLARACRVDAFDFALPVAREDGRLVARPAW